MSTPAKKIVIAAGGTGGHVFPAQALARQLEEKGYTVLFMGKGLSTNRYFSRDLFASVSIDSATPFQKGLFQKLFSFVCLGKGIFQAFRKIREFKPDLVVGFGSFHAFPVLAAGALCKIPMTLFESNSVPGKVNRIFSRYSLFCGVQFPEAKKWLKGTCHEVKMPFWKEKQKQEGKKEASEYFSLETDLFTVLVFGGSQGAAFINPIIAETLAQFHAEHRPIQVIHMTGSEASSEMIQKCYQVGSLRSCVKPFEKNMHLAWSHADLVICRAGAATISEMIEFEVPAIFIPYPAAADEHQLKNALFLSEEVKGSLCLEEKKLTRNALLSLLKTCNVEEMKSSVREFKERKQNRQLLDHIEEVLKK
jgi:UDP-N-acetylglucosamine--N-acetylmuramyl-(pentapeptide) pyrophosphoryl-undecaprenol N-acetylglucosamine transferase